MYKNYKEASLEIYDLAEAIRGAKNDDTEVVSFFDKILLDFKGKNVVIVGGGNSLYMHLLAKRGAKKVTCFEASSQLSEKNTVGNIHLAYPLDLVKLKPDHCDILLVPSSNWTTLLAPRGFAGLGAYVKESMIVTARVNQGTVFTSSAEPAIFDINGRIGFNDNYLRKQIHQSGFVEVHCLYTGGHINNALDKKVTKFNHLKGFSIASKNAKPRRNQKNDSHSLADKIYIAYKLPTKKYIV